MVASVSTAEDSGNVPTLHFSASLQGLREGTLMAVLPTHVVGERNATFLEPSRPAPAQPKSLESTPYSEFPNPKGVNYVNA